VCHGHVVVLLLQACKAVVAQLLPLPLIGHDVMRLRLRSLAGPGLKLMNLVMKGGRWPGPGVGDSAALDGLNSKVRVLVPGGTLMWGAGGWRGLGTDESSQRMNGRTGCGSTSNRKNWQAWGKARASRSDRTAQVCLPSSHHCFASSSRAGSLLRQAGQLLCAGDHHAAALPLFADLQWQEASAALMFSWWQKWALLVGSKHGSQPTTAAGRRCASASRPADVGACPCDSRQRYSQASIKCAAPSISTSLMACTWADGCPQRIFEPRQLTAGTSSGGTGPHSCTLPPRDLQAGEQAGGHTRRQAGRRAGGQARG